jgi:broad specificity phosphatase PhoE
MNIYLIRHALARYDTGEPYHLPPGPPLAEAGLEQAAAAARLLRHVHIDRVVSSPMRRCLMTAEPLAAQLGIDLQIDDDLGEMKQGEPLHDMQIRMLRAVLSQVDVETAALVSHAAPIEQLLGAITQGRVVLPPPGDRGARVGVGHVWQLIHHSGQWHARQLVDGGVKV